MQKPFAGPDRMSTAVSIDRIVPLLERIADDRTGCHGVFFSYRHAQEIHALGLKHEFTPGSPWTQVCISVVASAAFTPKVWVRILWSRPLLEYPTEECPPMEFPLSEAGVSMFGEAWPKITKEFANAIARGHP